MGRVLKYLAILAGLLLTFAVAGAVFLESRFFKNWLGNVLVVAAKRYVRGELSLGRLEGNLFRSLEFSQVLIASRGDTVFFAPKIALTFSPRPLWRKEIALDRIRINSLYLKISQLSDSTWNLGNLFVTDTSALGWVVHSAETVVRGGRVAVHPLEASPLLPHLVENLNATGAWIYADSVKSLRLREFNLRTRAPDFVVHELTFQFTQRKNELHLQDLIVRTAQNRFDGSGALYAAGQGRASSPRKATVKLSSDPLHLEEFSFAFPHLRIFGNPDLEVSTRLRGDSLRFRLAIREQAQHLDLQGDLSQWKKQPRFAVRGTLSNFDASTWLQNPKWASIVNGKFEVQGSGFFQRTLTLQGSADLQDCLLLRRNVQRIFLQGDYRDGKLQSHLNVQSDLGEAFIDATIGDSVHAQNFTLRADFKRLQVPHLFLADTRQTIFDLGLAAQGRGLHPDTLAAKIQLTLGPGLVAGVPVDTLWGAGEVNKKRFKIDTLNLHSPLGDFHLGGNFNRASSWALRFNGQVQDINYLQRFVAFDSMHARGKFSGAVRGYSDSLTALGRFALAPLRYHALAADTAAGEIFLRRHESRWQGRAEMHGRNLQAAPKDLAAHNGFAIEKALAAVFARDNRFNVHANFTDSLAAVELDFAQADSLNGRLTAQAAWSDSIKNVALTDFYFRVKNQIWSATQDTMRLVIGENFYQLQNVHLASGEQRIHAGGVWDWEGTLDFQCDLERLQVYSWLELFAPSFPAATALQMTGRFDAGVRLHGTAQSPLLEGEIHLREGRAGRIPYDSLQAEFNYENEKLHWHAKLQQNQANQITAEGFLPLPLADLNQGKILQSDSAMHVVISIPGCDLAVLQHQFPEIKEARGRLTGKLIVQNTPNDPQVEGALELKEGMLAIPRYGINYSGLRLEMAVKDRRLELKQLQFKRDKGTFTASGFAEYEMKNLQSGITNMQIRLQAANVLLANSRALELLLNGDVELGGTLEQPRFQGTVKVVRARVDVPTFTKIYDEYESEEQIAAPMLVAALAGQDSLAIALPPEEEKKEASEFYQNLRGNLRLDIPRNTWLRSPELNVEISGAVSLAKSGPDLELFGPIQVLRGTYVLPGIRKSFEVESGTLTFQGGADYDPDVDIYAQHVFRSANREKKKLRAHMTGKASALNFSFTLVENNVEIPETDALSYLIFGRSVEELAQGAAAENADGAGNNSNNAAREALTGMLSDQLSRRLGRELGVDVLQLRGNENFQQLSFLVGKYLTNDLFVSYQDQVGARDANEPVYSLTLEYEVARFLFLQLIKGDTKSTGFDAIIKIER